MGNFICKRSHPPKILFQGLDASGKTSMMYRLKLGEVITTPPTIGFNVEHIDIGCMEMVGWDIGGRDKMRPLLRHYYPGTAGIVYVIDSKDTERLDETLDELNLHVLTNEDTSGKVVMVLANKQDLPGALSCDEIERKWKEKNTNVSNHVLLFKPCSVVTGEGLVEAFTDLGEQLNNVTSKEEEGKLQDAEDNHEMSLKLLINRPVGFLKALLTY